MLPSYLYPIPPFPDNIKWERLLQDRKRKDDKIADEKNAHLCVHDECYVEVDNYSWENMKEVWWNESTPPPMDSVPIEIEAKDLPPFHNKNFVLGDFTLFPL